MKGSPKKLVLSVGKGNSYYHPRQESIDEYQKPGWDWTVVLTQDPHECHSHGRAHMHGNTLLKFSINAADPQCGCGIVQEGNLCLIPSHAPVIAPIAPTRRKDEKNTIT